MTLLGTLYVDTHPCVLYSQYCNPTAVAEETANGPWGGTGRGTRHEARDTCQKWRDKVKGKNKEQWTSPASIKDASVSSEFGKAVMLMMKSM